MPLYLLDTNIISDAIRNTRGACATRIKGMAPDSLCTSIIVAAELRFGVEKRGSAEWKNRVDRVLASLSVMALNGDADKFYERLRTTLERQGQLIGANDMLIAAHALSIDAVLVTDNTNEFARVADLRIENWLVHSPG
ncbi:type II toxin-antitoxin system VapC family toxin [Mycetohabitans rhizoxinica]|uniref:type II toxin-antitoxin system VapC family toxin n=1 Tax=Mycetohabitans rhizoxinica TaxID=412963 RepID=UPI0030CC4EF4